MQITINLPPDLEIYLTHQAQKVDLPLQTLILQALRQLVPLASSQWPETILTYEGVPDFPAFESHREDLLSPREVELF